MKKILTNLPIIIVTIGLVLFFFKLVNKPENTSFQSSTLVGKKLNDFSVEEFSTEKSSQDNKSDGKKSKALKIITNKDFAGSITVINLFASWCTTCIYEHPHLLKLKKIKNIKTLGIAWRDSKSKISKFLSQNGNPYQRVGFDALGKAGIAIGITGLPETIVIDKNSVIIMHQRGNIDEEFIAEIQSFAEKN